MCAEFARPEVLQMLQTVLPEETALVRPIPPLAWDLANRRTKILWYNKSRATGRICPACQRLYRLGDTLPEHEVGEGGDRQMKKPPAQLRREQEISGFCACTPLISLCYILAHILSLVERLSCLLRPCFLYLPESYQGCLGQNGRRHRR